MIMMMVIIIMIIIIVIILSHITCAKPRCPQCSLISSQQPAEHHILGVMMFSEFYFDAL